MKALVLNALGRGFDFEDVDIAAPIGREVLVDVQASGLCHTDLLFATHDFVPTPSGARSRGRGDRGCSRPRRRAVPRRRSRRRFSRAVVRGVRSMSVRPLLPVQTSGVDAAPTDRCPAPEPQRGWLVPGLRARRLRRTGAHPREPARRRAQGAALRPGGAARLRRRHGRRLRLEHRQRQRRRHGRDLRRRRRRAQCRQRRAHRRRVEDRRHRHPAEATRGGPTIRRHRRHRLHEDEAGRGRPRSSAGRRRSRLRLRGAEVGGRAGARHARRRRRTLPGRGGEDPMSTSV